MVFRSAGVWRPLMAGSARLERSRNPAEVCSSRSRSSTPRPSAAVRSSHPCRWPPGTCSSRSPLRGVPAGRPSRPARGARSADDGQIVEAEHGFDEGRRPRGFTSGHVVPASRLAAHVEDAEPDAEGAGDGPGVAAQRDQPRAPVGRANGDPCCSAARASRARSRGIRAEHRVVFLSGPGPALVGRCALDLVDVARVVERRMYARHTSVTRTGRRLDTSRSRLADAKRGGDHSAS